MIGVEKILGVHSQWKTKYYKEYNSRSMISSVSMFVRSMRAVSVFFSVRRLFPSIIASIIIIMSTMTIVIISAVIVTIIPTIMSTPVLFSIIRMRSMRSSVFIIRGKGRTQKLIWMHIRYLHRVRDIKGCMKLWHTVAKKHLISQLN